MNQIYLWIGVGIVGIAFLIDLLRDFPIYTRMLIWAVAIFAGVIFLAMYLGEPVNLSLIGIAALAGVVVGVIGPIPAWIFKLLGGRGR